MLYIIATPIGNLKDISLRALETLRQVDGVICEDSRRASKLLNHFQITKPLIVLNDYNESKITPLIIEKLTKEGQNLALISDAGTPLISDPGYKLVRQAIFEGISVDSLPGPASPIVALTLSSLPPDKFFFLGYPPEKSGRRQQFYLMIKAIAEIISTTFIILVSPHKLTKTLEEIRATFGDIDITLARELTKIYQTVKTRKITEWLEEFDKIKPKGEWIMLIRLD
ncbi:16S rRNA (cytidine(1402)-2'-O)-methyltransferase [Candidatus Daviesbacteria bacterium]|nr:16S rRNA (cytidine(1402)-2'-O)-methyltransferase [Candidatus Daviesbacteria bacterium]